MSENDLPRLNETEMKVLRGLADLYQNCEEFRRDVTSRPILMDKLGLTPTQYDNVMPRMEQIEVVAIEKYRAMRDEYGATVEILPIVSSVWDQIERQEAGSDLLPGKKLWAWVASQVWKLILGIAIGIGVLLFAWWWTQRNEQTETTKQNASNTESAIIQESNPAPKE